MESQKRKQKTLSLAEKVRIVEEFEKDGGSHEALARKYGVGFSTVTRFIHQKEELRKKFARFSEHGVMNRKTMKGQSFSLLEEVLFIWLLQQLEANSIAPTDVLRAKESMFRELQNRGFNKEAYLVFLDKLVSLKLKMCQVYNATSEIFSNEEIIDSVLNVDFDPVPV